MKRGSRPTLLLLVIGAVVVLVGSMVWGMGGEPVATDSSSSGAEPAGRERIRVEVLNASGVPGMARRGTERLRAGGIDVVYYGNATGFAPDTSLVLDRLNDPDAAARVAQALGIDEVRSMPDTTLYVDVSVILGRDWEQQPADP